MRWLVVLAMVAACRGSAVAPAAPASDDDALVGVWKAKRRFGPDARGPLLLARGAAGWTADFVGRRLAVREERGELSFTLDGAGGFRGRRAGDAIVGHWSQPRSVVHGMAFATPVRLVADGEARWRGEVAPLDDELTLYLVIARRPDGALAAFLRNPERNLGARYDLDRVERDGSTVRLLGRRALTAHLDGETLTLALPERGGSYDFRRDGDASEVYPRGRRPARYAYQPPPALADGWPTAALADVAISRAGVEAFVQHLIDQPIDSVHAPEVHGVLIARHGKLVLEEYFHGEHRDHLHDTRSAAKSLTALIAGAALRTGPLTLASRVYDTFGVPGDPRKQAMTLEHLLMMRSGYFCDDGNPDAPGNEGVIDEQTADPDYYHYSLRVPLESAPGTRSVYCSMSPNLALGMVGRAAGASPLAIFDAQVAGALGFGRYAWPLDPAGQPYGGGGVRALPRDFMKLGQLMLEGGSWHGRPIVTPDFAARATSALHDLNGVQYGYLWWSIAYPYRARTVRAYFAAGNGGQTVMVVPDLDLVVAIYAGNFSDRAPMLHVQQELVPTWILPAVREPGEDPEAPVAPRPFTSPYGRPR